MKTYQFVMTSLLILTIGFSIGAITNLKTKDKTISSRIDVLEQRITKQPPSQTVFNEPDYTGLVAKVEELARYTERLEMENAAQADYIREMGKVWDGWASKNNFPKEGGEK